MAERQKGFKESFTFTFDYHIDATVMS